MEVENPIEQLQAVENDAKMESTHDDTQIYTEYTNALYRITSQRLLDQSQAHAYTGKRHIPPHFGPFWAYSRTLPQGVELLV